MTENGCVIAIFAVPTTSDSRVSSGVTFLLCVLEPHSRRCLDQGLVDEFIHEVIWFLLLVVRQRLATRLKPGHGMLAVALEGVAAMENAVVVQQDHVTLLEGDCEMAPKKGTCFNTPNISKHVPKREVKVTKYLCKTVSYSLWGPKGVYIT